MSEPIPTSCRGGWLIRSGWLIALLGIMGAAAWTVLLPGIAVSTLRARTGFVLKVDQLSVNPFTGRVNIVAAVVENPVGWPTREFLVLRRFQVEAELLPLWHHRLVADEMIVEVELLSLVRNQEGRLNSEVFRDGLAKNKTAPDGPKPAGPKSGFLVRHLVLKFDRLVIADYSGSRPAVKEYNLKIARDMRDVDSVAKLVSPFLEAGLLDPAGLFTATPGALGGTLNALQQTGKKTGETLKKFFQSLEKKKP